MKVLLQAKDPLPQWLADDHIILQPVIERNQADLPKRICSTVWPSAIHPCVGEGISGCVNKDRTTRSIRRIRMLVKPPKIRFFPNLLSLEIQFH